MNKEIANIFTLILIVIIILVELLRKKEKGTLDIFTGVNFVYLLCFGIIQIIFINFDIRPELNTITPNLASINFHYDNYGFTSMISLYGYLMILIGVYWNGIKRKNNKKLKYKYIINYRRIYVLAIITFLIGIFSNFRYLIMFGGISNSISLSQDLRFNAVLENSGYIRILQPIIILSNISFIVIYERYRSKKYLAFVLLTYIVSIYYLFTYAGRLPLFLFLVTIPLYIMEKNKEFTTKNIFIIAIVGLIIIVFGEYAFDYLSGKSVYVNLNIKDNINRLLVQFSFPYINLLKVNEFVKNTGYRYFVDTFTWVINIIPNNILSIFKMGKITTSYQMNTANFFSQELGGVPVDIISLGFYQLSIVGVTLFTYIFGRIVGYFQKLTYKADSSLLIMLKVRMFIFLSMIIMYSDIDVIFKRRIEYWLFAVVSILACKKNVDNCKE